MRRWSTAVATRSLYQIEYRVRRLDGEYRNMLTRGVPIYAGDGELREWFGTCVDITDLKRAEEAVRESEERFRGTFENAAVGIAHKDPQAASCSSTRSSATSSATPATSCSQRPGRTSLILMTWRPALRSTAP